MTKEEWTMHVNLLKEHLREFYQYDGGYSLKQKEKFSKQRAKAIRKIKDDLNWPPFANIALDKTKSSWGFDECHDSMDWGMEQTIQEILNTNYL